MDLLSKKYKQAEEISELKAEIDKLKTCLQEIKAIAEKEIYMKQNSSMNRILDLITKAEEE